MAYIAQSGSVLQNLVVKHDCAMCDCYFELILQYKSNVNDHNILRLKKVKVKPPYWQCLYGQTGPHRQRLSRFPSYKVTIRALLLSYMGCKSSPSILLPVVTNYVLSNVRLTFRTDILWLQVIKTVANSIFIRKNPIYIYTFNKLHTRFTKLVSSSFFIVSYMATNWRGLRRNYFVSRVCKSVCWK